MAKVNRESHLIRREPCPACGSRDNLGRYSDGHAFCFGASCGYYEPADKEPDGKGSSDAEVQASRQAQQKGLLQVEIPEAGLPVRHLSAETCRKWSYGISEDKHGTPVQVAQYRDRGGRIVAQKLRYGDKRSFPWVGTPKEATLFGAHLWGGGRRLVVTEGEVDAMSVSQVQGHKWPVVSVVNGASGAKRDLLKALDYLEQFEEIVLLFDNDEPGQAAAKECAEALIPLKVKIAALPLKDANEMLKAGRSDELVRAIWNATEYRPEGIIAASQCRDAVRLDVAASSISYPWDGLNKIVRGLRSAELVVITAGTGIGKSAVVREIIYDLMMKGETVGALMLEESVKRTIDGLVGLHLNKPIHYDREGLTEEEILAAFDDLFSNGRELYLFDHFGSTEVDALLSRVRYMVKALRCKWIVLDHISIVVSGLKTNDERKAIDEIMTHLRTLVQQTGVGLIAVCHLRRPDGDKGHENGHEVVLGHLRGSHSIGQLSDIVIGLERNQQDPESRNIMRVRILKNRLTGETGVACELLYDPSTGRLTEYEGGPVFRDEADKREPAETDF